jgi:hypothetical protein
MLILRFIVKLIFCLYLYFSDMIGKNNVLVLRNKKKL